jgi:hypothetical protein
VGGRNKRNGSQDGGILSFNTRRIIALAVVLLASTFGGVLTVSFFDSRVAAVLGVLAGAVVGAALVVIWASRGS